MPLTTTENIKDYLDSKSIQYSTITTLEGGTGNYVWLITPKDGPSFVIKHAEPYVKVNPSIPFSVDRMSFEAKALGTLVGDLPSDQFIQLPKLLQYDEENDILFMTGSASRTFKDSYTDSTLDVSTWGHRLGEWLARLHGSTTQMALGDNKTAKDIYRYCYSRLGGAMKKYELDGALGIRINEKYGSLLETDDDSVCHGDFWPGNILFAKHDSNIATVIDWEMVRRGCGATDVGQFAAEAHLLDRFRGGRGLLSAFLLGYRGRRSLSRGFVVRVAIHFSTHLGFWPTVVSWASKEETAEVVRLGAEMLQNVEQNGYEGMKGGVLKDLVD